MKDLWPGLLTLAGILAGGYLTYLASRRNKRQDVSLQLINEHQEDIASLRTRVAVLEKTQRVQGDYVGQLRKHIADGKPPPPPPYPDGLIT